MAKTTKQAQKPKVVEVWYINATGKKVVDTTGRIDPEKLWYVQPDGSYERGGDRRSLGHLKKPVPKKKAKPALKSH